MNIAGANLSSSDSDTPARLSQILREPALCHSWQVPSFTRQYCLGVARDLDANRLESGRCCSSCTECLREEVIQKLAYTILTAREP
jgi:hypothetical protein